MLLLDVIGFDHYKDDNSDDYDERYEGEQLLVLSLDSRPRPWSFFPNDGMVIFFSRAPLPSMVFQWFCCNKTITIECFFPD